MKQIGDLKNPPPFDLTGQVLTEEWRFTNCTGLRIYAGEFAGGQNPALLAHDYGLRLIGCDDVVIDGGWFHGHRAGITLDQCSNFKIRGVRMSGMYSDGIDVARSRAGLIEWCLFHDFDMSAGAHPDAIQFIDTAPGNSDMEVRYNTVHGKMQGIFDHIGSGKVHHNLVYNTFAQGIGLIGAGPLQLQDNVVGSVSWPKLMPAGQQYQSRIVLNFPDGQVVKAGNSYEAFSSKKPYADPVA